MKRPILWVAVSFACGTALASTALGGWPYATPAIAVFGMAVAMSAGYDRRLFVAGMCVLFGAAGLFRSEIGRSDWTDDAFCKWAYTNAPESVTVHGTIRHAELFASGDDYLQFVMDVASIRYQNEERPIGGRVLVRWNGAGRPLFAGDTVQMRGVPSVVMSPVNWDVYSSEDSLRRRGVHTMMRCRGSAALSGYEAGNPFWPLNAAGRFRHALAERLTDAVPESARAFIFAVWLGERSHLTEDQYDAFIRSGTAHILAVSGVHTSIVFVTVSFVLGRFIRIARYRAIFIMVAIAIFALTAGARVATIRAAIMIAVYVMADVFNRERDAPTALGIAGFGFLLWDPTLLFDGGTQLSFLSVASILIFGDRLSEGIPLLKPPIRQAVSTTLSVQLLPLPIAAGMFHLVPRFAPIANLLVVPMLGVVLWLCLITSVTAFISPPLALLFGHAAAGVTYAIQAVAETVADLPFSVHPMTKPTALATGLYWTALGVAVVRSRLEGRRRVIAVIALLIGAFIFWRPMDVPAQIRILDVGHGDAAIYHSADDKVVVIDGGDKSEYGDMGGRVVIPALSAMGVSHVDLLVVSHSDRDHLGGLITVVDRLSVGGVIMGPPDPDNPVESDFLEACERRHVRVVRAARGDRFQLGRSSLTVLHPPADWPSNHSRNDFSLAVRLDWEGPPVLFTGDIEAAGERALVSEDIGATILKVPHHGSDSSSMQAFINAVAPEFALISAGESRGRISNPGAVVARYEQAGVDIWRTSVSGGLRLELDAGRVRIEGARPARDFPGASETAP